MSRDGCRLGERTKISKHVVVGNWSQAGRPPIWQPPIVTLEACRSFVGHPTYYERVVHKYRSRRTEKRISLSIPGVDKGLLKRGHIRGPRPFLFPETIITRILWYCRPPPWKVAFAQELDQVQQIFHIIQNVRFCKETINFRPHLRREKLTIAGKTRNAREHGC